MSRMFVLVSDDVRRRACAAISGAPEGYVVKISEATRALSANAALWPILVALSEQLEWPVNGKMMKMTPDEWKDVTTAAFQNETARLAMGLDGGVVMLGLRTSQMPAKKFSEYLDFLNAVCGERGVIVYEDSRP